MENKKKLKICFLGTAKSIHTLKWIEYFAEKGHDVFLVSYDELLKDYKPKNKTIRFYFLERRIPVTIWPLNTILNLPFSFLRVKKIINKEKPDIIHAHYVNSYGTLGSLLNFHPFVITAWGSDILITPQKFLPLKWTTKYALSRADLITCDAEHMKKAITRLGVGPQKIKIINFGIDIKKFSPGPNKEKAKRKISIPSNSPVVVSLRRLVPISDITTLIKGAYLVKKEFPKTIFVIIGGGPEEEKLKKLARKLKLDKNIKFISWVSNEDLPKYLRAVDVYVSTSLSDAGIAASTAEAMACGLPVVITDVADNKEWVKDGENGFLFSPKDHKELAKKIIYLLKDENKRIKMGKTARRVIEEKNNYYKEMEKMEEIYFDLIKKNYEEN